MSVVRLARQHLTNFQTHGTTVDDLFAVGDHILLDRVLHRRITRIDLEDGEPQIYVQLWRTPRLMRTVLGQLVTVEEGPFSPDQVMPYRPSKRARWRRRFGLTPASRAVNPCLPANRTFSGGHLGDSKSARPRGEVWRLEHCGVRRAPLPQHD